MVTSMRNRIRKDIKQIHKCSSPAPSDNYFKYILNYFGPRERKVLKRTKIRSLSEFISVKDNDLKGLMTGSPSSLNKIFKVQEAVNNIIKSNKTQLELLTKDEFLFDLEKNISTINQDDKQEKEALCQANRDDAGG